MKIGKFIGSVFAAKKGEMVKNIGEAIDGVFTNKEELLIAKAKIQEIANKHEIDFKEIELKEIESFLQDRENARNREIEIAKTNGNWLSKNILPFLALLTVGLTFVLFYIITFIELIPEKKEIILYILGALTSIDIQIYSYYFGSSKSSNDKNESIKNLMQSKNDN